MKKKFLGLICLTLTLLIVFCGCSANIRLSDIYVNHASLTEFDGAVKEGSLPKNFTIAYANTSNYNNPFFATRSWVIIKDSSNRLGIYDYVQGKWVIGDQDNLFTEIKKSENFVATRTTSSSTAEMKVYNCSTLTPVALKSNSIVWNYIKIGDEFGKYFLYDKGNDVEIYNGAGYLTQIYDLGYSVVYDKYLVNKNSYNTAPSECRIYELPSVRDENTDSFTRPKDKGTFKDSEVYVSYLGGGKFYVFMQTSATSGDYDYKYNTKYYKGRVNVYNSVTDTIEQNYKDDKYYLNIVSATNQLLSNSYGDLYLSISDVLKSGYDMVDVGLSIDSTSKNASADQFILDKNGNIVVSLTGRYGKDVNINGGKVSGFSPLFLLFIDGKGFSPNMSLGTIRLMNIDGTTAFEKTDSTYQNLFYNDASLVCQRFMPEKANTYNPNRYGAYDQKGTRIIDFDYDYMTPFISGVSIAYNLFLKDDETVRLSDIYLEKGIWYKPNGESLGKDFVPKNAETVKKVYRLNKDGNAAPITDMAMTSKSNNYQLIFKLGAYVNKNPDGTYNVKNFSGEKLFSEDFKDIVIDKPNLDDVKIYGTRNGIIEIYSLTSSTRGSANYRTVHDIIVPVTVIASICLAAVVIIVLMDIKHKSDTAKGKSATADNENKKIKVDKDGKK